VKRAPQETTAEDLESSIETQAKAHLVDLGLLPDPTSSSFLQLAEFALDDMRPSSRKSFLTAQLEVLRGMRGTKALVWLLRDTEGFELLEDPAAAAGQALQQLDSRMSAQIPGYPPLAGRTLF
jgi:hypothetical protein